MANLLSNTTIGGYQSIHTGNIGSYAITSLSDTLASITGRGATTTNAITIGALSKVLRTGNSNHDTIFKIENVDSVGGTFGFNFATYSDGGSNRVLELGGYNTTGNNFTGVWQFNSRPILNSGIQNNYWNNFDIYHINSNAGQAIRFFSLGPSGGGGVIVQFVNDGNVLIGNSPTNSARLVVKGSGTTSSTTSLLVQNSAGTNLLQVRDDGATFVNGYFQFASDAAGSNYLNFSRQSQNNWEMNSGGVGRIFQISGNTITFEQDTIIKRGGLSVTPTLGSTALYVKSTGITSASTSLLVQNSAGTEIFRTYDNQVIILGANTWDSTFYSLWSSYGTRINNGNLSIFSSGGTSTSGPSYELNFYARYYNPGQGYQTNKSGYIVGNAVGVSNDAGSGRGTLTLGTVYTGYADYSINSVPTIYLTNTAVSGSVSGSGKVGINQPSPTASLHISGSGTTSSTTSLLVQNSAGNSVITATDDKTVLIGNSNGANSSYIHVRHADSIKIHSFSGYGMLFTNGETTAMMIDGYSNVGIGTTSIYSTTKLKVKGADSGLILLVSGDTKGVRIGADTNGGFIGGVDQTGFGSDQPLTFRATKYQFDLGNVLINTSTDAGYKLDVNGTARIQSTLYTNTISATGTLNIANGNYTVAFPATGKTPVSFDLANAPHAALTLNGSGPVVSNLLSNGTIEATGSLYTNGNLVAGIDRGTSGWTSVPIRPGYPLSNANNAAGLDLTIQGGQGTGTGVGGDILFKVKSADGAGTQVLSTLSTFMSIKQLTGRVGIGLTNPQGAAHIAVASGTPALILSDVGAPDTIPTFQFRRGPLSAFSLQVDFPSNNKARFQIGDAVTGYELTGGNLGLTGGKSIEFAGITGQTATAIVGSVHTDNNNGQLVFSTRGSAVTAERMRISSSGNVGIGTDQPVGQLNVFGGTGNNPAILTLQSQSGGGGNTGIYFRPYQNVTFANTAPAQATILAVDASYSAHITFSTKIPGSGSNALVERMRLSSTGSLMIGSTTDTGEALQVTGSIKSTALSTNGPVVSSGGVLNSVNGYTGMVTIQQPAPMPPITFDIQNGIIVNVMM